MQKLTWEDYTNSQKKNPPKVNKSHIIQSSHLVLSVTELDIQLGWCQGRHTSYFPIFSLFQYLWCFRMLHPMSQMQWRCSYVQTLMAGLVTSGHYLFPRGRTGHYSSHLCLQRTWAVPLCLLCPQWQPSVTGFNTDLCIYSNKTHSDCIHYREQ